VIQNSESGSSSIGRNGDGLGYDGIVNSLVVEFDTFANRNDFGDGDDYTQHIRLLYHLSTIVVLFLAHSSLSC
jgi:hypothetical protein